MTVKAYDKLPVEAKKIREDVFVKEQGFESEFDSIDSIAIHFVMFDDRGNAAAVCRAFCGDDGREYHLGRLAVKKEYRNRHLGAEILMAAEEHVKSAGGQEMVLAAQVRASDFYAKQGYEKYGDIFYDEHCPHIMMKKVL